MTQNTSKTTVSNRLNELENIVKDLVERNKRLEEIIENQNVSKKKVVKSSNINLDDINIEDLKSDNRRGRFTDDEIRKIRNLRKSGVPYNKISNIFGVSSTFIRNVELKNVYKHVED